MSEWIVALVRSSGLAGIVFLMTLENVFPPIPSELIMPLAGYLAASDHMTLWGAIAAGTFGSLLGAFALYYLGVRVGRERLERFAQRHGCWLALSRRDIERADRWLERHGALAVFLCRLVPGIRSLISIPAGIARMNLAMFTIATTVGTALWTTALAGAGYALGRKFAAVESWVGWISLAVFVVLVGWYTVRIWRHYHGGAATARRVPQG